MDRWRSELEAAIASAVALAGESEVAAALAAELDGLTRAERPAALRPEAAVLGVSGDAFRVAILLGPDGPPAVLGAETLPGVIELARDRAEVAVLALGVTEATVAGVAQAGDRLPQRWAGTIIAASAAHSFAELGASASASGEDRRATLGRVGLSAPAWYAGSGFAESDLLDACAVAWTAARHLAGQSRPVDAARGETRLWV